MPLLHGAAGEDGALRDLLESLRIPFVGSGAAASRLAFDKPITKELVTQAGLRTPECVAMPQSTFRELGAAAVLDAVVERLGLPLVVKPTRGGSSLGTSIVHSAADLPSAMVGAFAYGDVVMLEKYIAGTELAIGVFEQDDDLLALSAVEIVPEGELYDYAARYTAGTTEFFCPARLDDETAERAQAVALNAHLLLGLRDLSRTDVIVDADGVPWFLEVERGSGDDRDVALPAGARRGRRRPRRRHRAARRVGGPALLSAGGSAPALSPSKTRCRCSTIGGRRDVLASSVAVDQVDDPAEVLEISALDHESSAGSRGREAVRVHAGVE